VLCNHAYEVGLPPVVFHTGGLCILPWELPRLALQVSAMLIVHAGRSMDQAEGISSRAVANQRLPASCMNLNQLQPMESVCTLLHGAAGVRMCLFYMQCMSCCWSLFLLERSGGPMAVGLKFSCSGRVYHRGCTCEGDVGFYFSFLT
jgi:hypothetical protein